MEPVNEEMKELQGREEKQKDQDVVDNSQDDMESDGEKLSRRQLKKRKRFENIQNHYKEKKKAMKLKRKMQRQEMATKKKEEGKESDGRKI